MMSASNPSRRIFAVAAGLFVIWGLALWLYNSLFFKFARFFALGPSEIASTLAMFHIAYLLLAIPAVLFIRQFGFKLSVLAGLSVFGIGAFLLYLALIEHAAIFFLAAVFVISASGAWLDTALNPLAALGGDRSKLLQRMNLAHSFSGAGLFAACLIGVTVLGRDYVLSVNTTAQDTARPYVLVGLGAILLAYLIEQITLPDAASKGTAKIAPRRESFAAEWRGVTGDRGFVFAAAALAAYCAVLTVLWTANYKYVHTELPGHVVPLIERGWLWFVLGRLSGTFAMRWIDPLKLLACSAIGCIGAIAVAVIAGGESGWIALVAASFFLATTYPTLFGDALGRHWERLATAAGLLVVAAAIGNAVSSLLSSFILDAAQWSPRLVIALALPFEAIVLAYALKAKPAATTE